jgi:hypothetical protein
MLAAAPTVLSGSTSQPGKLAGGVTGGVIRYYNIIYTWLMT